MVISRQRGNAMNFGSRRFRQEIDKTASVPHKIMLRLDREFRRRGVRSYRGYETRGINYARLNFYQFAINVDPFGRLSRVVR